MKDAQEQLKNLFIYQGKIDGINGTYTNLSIKEFQRRAGLEVGGILGPITKEALSIGTRSYINIDKPETTIFLVRPGQKYNQIWAMLPLSKRHREELDEEIRNYQEIWTDTKQTDYNWAMYELYKEFGLTYEGMKVMMKIKETLK